MLKRVIHCLLKFVYPAVKNIIPYQVYAYLAVGATNTLLNIGLFMIIYQALAYWLLAVEAATIISFLITVASGFWLSKNFAFTEAGNERSEKARQFGKYFIVSLQGQFSDYVITKGLVLFLVVNPKAAYLLSTVIMLTINYFLQKYFTFRRKTINTR